jgi:hypothetical protein
MKFINNTRAPISLHTVELAHGGIKILQAKPVCLVPQNSTQFPQQKSLSSSAILSKSLLSISDAREETDDPGKSGDRSKFLIKRIHRSSNQQGN